MSKEDFILFSGGARGTEAEFGLNAEKHEIEEINFTFEGHHIERGRGHRVLNHEELGAGDVSLEYVSRLMNRRYSTSRTFRKVLQSIWYQINNAQQVFVVGEIQDDNTVKGGTGWGAELAKICNKPLYVFGQVKNKWVHWTGTEFEDIDPPTITQVHFAGTGTRNIEANGKQAIAELFDRSFS